MTLLEIQLYQQNPGLDDPYFPSAQTLLKAPFWRDDAYERVRRMLAMPQLATEIEGVGTSVRTVSVCGTPSRVKFFNGLVPLPAEVAVIPIRTIVFTAFKNDEQWIESLEVVPARTLLGRLPVVIIGDPNIPFHLRRVFTLYSQLAHLNRGFFFSLLWLPLSNCVTIQTPRGQSGYAHQ